MCNTGSNVGVKADDIGKCVVVDADRLCLGPRRQHVKVLVRVVIFWNQHVAEIRNLLAITEIADNDTSGGRDAADRAAVDTKQLIEHRVVWIIEYKESLVSPR